MHDASKVLLGTTVSTAKEISNHSADPATFLAGLAVRQKSDGDLSLAKADGMHVGVSLGRSLSDSLKTAVLRTGEGVPMRLELKKAQGTIEITSYANLVSGTEDTIEVAGVVFTAQSGAATPGDATFQAATNNNDTATSLAAQINAHATASPLVKAVATDAEVVVYAKVGGAAGNAYTLAYTDNDTNVGATVTGAGTLTTGSDDFDDIDYVTIGQKAYIDDFNGKVTSSDVDSTISDATFVSGVLTGIDESGAQVAAVLVDMPGGL